MSTYFNRVRDLIADPFYPCNPIAALCIAATAANRRSYDDSNYYVEISFKGRVLSRRALPFNTDTANRLGRIIAQLGDAE